MFHFWFSVVYRDTPEGYSSTRGFSLKTLQTKFGCAPKKWGNESTDLSWFGVTCNSLLVLARLMSLSISAETPHYHREISPSGTHFEQFGMPISHGTRIARLRPACHDHSESRGPGAWRRNTENNRCVRIHIRSKNAGRRGKSHQQWP
jgi:hypothetical protein